MVTVVHERFVKENYDFAQLRAFINGSPQHIYLMLVLFGTKGYFVTSSRVTKS